MNFYAFVPDKNGYSPVGTEGRHLIHNLKTIAGAMRRARRYLGTEQYVLYSYTNFYDNKTFTLRYNGTNTTPKLG